MIFKTRVDLFYKLVIVFVFILFGFILLNIDYKNEVIGFYLTLFILLLILLIFIGTALTTKFILTDSELYCKTFVWKKTIPLDTIRKVEKQNYLFSGWKISTAYKGIIIHYNKFDELLISPEKEAIFMEEILDRINKMPKN
jgi:energy-coupling factor transporter transmembrane protein EcfT